MFVLSWYKTLLRVVYSCTCDLPLSVFSIAQQKSNPEYQEKKIDVSYYDYDEDLNNFSKYILNYISYFNMKCNKQHKDIKGSNTQIMVVG